MKLQRPTFTGVALVLGSTWIVISVALLASLVANLMVLRFPWPDARHGVLLVVVARSEFRPLTAMAG